jgi:asparagine synthase (glutamine-hydrolysing)
VPGLSIAYTSDTAPATDAPAWERAVAATRCDAPSTQSTLFRDSRCRIGSSVYPGYPLEWRESESAFVCLEGRVDRLEPAAALEDLHRIAADDSEDIGAQLRAHLSAWGGDFVALIYAKPSQRLWIASDSMGRLPLYVRSTGRTLLASRDQRFLLALDGRPAPDRIGIAQMLLFGFPLGTRTLIAGVERTRPGALLEGDRGGVRLASLGSGSPALEHKGRASFSRERNAADLADLFAEVCRERARAAGQVLLALSGGMDSRAVAAALARASIPFEAATFVDTSGRHDREAEVAAAVAAALGAPWRMLRLPAPLGDRLQRLLHMKMGLNTLGMASSFDFFAMTRTLFRSSQTLWTGDGGDKALPDLRPRLGARRRSDLVPYLIEKNQVWPLHEVARLMGLEERAVMDSVRAVVEAYTEHEPEQRYVRFLLSERGYRWILEGEDTNRHYYWTVTPFEDRAFVEAAMACPDEQKSGYRLYRCFLRNLSPAVTRIADANQGIPMSSPLYVWGRRARELSRYFPGLQRWLRRSGAASVLGPQQAAVRDLLVRQAEHSAVVKEWFAPAELGRVAGEVQRFTPYAVECLLTATCVAEQIVQGRSTLDGMLDATFG